MPIAVDLPMPRPMIRRGDSLPMIKVVASGVESDPEDALVTASLFRLGTAELAAEDLEASIDSDSTETPWTVTLSFDPALLAEEEGLRAGRYFLRFTVTFADAEVITIPPDDSLTLSIQ
jgi:hypothetical protein